MSVRVIVLNDPTDRLVHCTGHPSAAQRAQQLILAQITGFKVASGFGNVGTAVHSSTLRFHVSTPPLFAFTSALFVGYVW
jgi:hypothetical protein